MLQTGSLILAFGSIVFYQKTYHFLCKLILRFAVLNRMFLPRIHLNIVDQVGLPCVFMSVGFCLYAQLRNGLLILNIKSKLCFCELLRGQKMTE